MINDWQIKAMVEYMREHHIPPGKIETQGQADLFTLNDPIGQVWQVGDTYYTVSALKEEDNAHRL